MKQIIFAMAVAVFGYFFTALSVSLSFFSGFQQWVCSHPRWSRAIGLAIIMIGVVPLPYVIWISINGTTLKNIVDTIKDHDTNEIIRLAQLEKALKIILESKNSEDKQPNESSAAPSPKTSDAHPTKVPESSAQVVRVVIRADGAKANFIVDGNQYVPDGYSRGDYYADIVLSAGHHEIYAANGVWTCSTGIDVPLKQETPWVATSCNP